MQEKTYKPAHLKADFEAYLDGFSSNVQEILDKFKFRNQIPTLIEADILGHLIEKFLDSRVNLSPRPVRDADGNELLPALDNHSMGTIFEELIRRFNEENNEEAGEHFTPLDHRKRLAGGHHRPARRRQGPIQLPVLICRGVAVIVLVSNSIGFTLGTI